jgi:hypothetical protein
MGEAVHLRILKFRKYLYILVVIDLKVGQHEAAAVGRSLIQAKRLLESEDLAVELAGSGNIIGAQADVRDADNCGTYYWGRLAKSLRGERTANEDSQHGSQKCERRRFHELAY